MKVHRDNRPHDNRLTDDNLFWGGGLLGIVVLSILPLEDIAEEKEPGCIDYLKERSTEI
jgi:hypothetical protein